MTLIKTKTSIQGEDPPDEKVLIYVTYVKQKSGDGLGIEEVKCDDGGGDGWWKGLWG